MNKTVEALLRAARGWIRGLVGAVVLTLVVAAPVAGAQETAGSAPGQAGSAETRSVVVEVLEGRLTVKVHEAPLAEVLQEVARHADLKVFSQGEITEKITAEFEDLALDEGVQRLIGNRGYIFIYSWEGGESVPKRLVKVWLLSPAVAASPTPGGRAAEGPGAPHPQGLGQWVQTAQFGPDPQVRTRAIHWLGSLGGEEAAETLGILLQQESDSSLRLEAARALARIGGPDGVSALESGLQDPASHVRREVIRALRRSEDEAAVALLTQALLTDQDPQIRREAASALRRQGGEAARDALRSGLEDSDASVRKAVENALRRLE